MKTSDMKNSEDTLINLSRRVLDGRVDQLDDKIVARLRSARRRAIDVVAKKYERPAWMNPIGGLVTATMVVGVATTLWVTNPSPPRQGMEDIELLASVESPEFYQDLDFYLWLEARASAG